ncbi:MAG: MFS transporter [Gaiellaceae bacterium]
MAGGVGERLRESLGAFGAVVRNPNLRRVELAWAASNIGRWAYFVALAVFAYQQGGAAAVGLVALIRMLPSALVAPFTAILGDKYRRERVMLVASLGQAATIGAAGVVVLSDAPAWIVYMLAGLNTSIGTAFRPAQSAVLPSLARTPQELTAANVVASTVESAGIFIGPAIGGLLLAVSSTGIVFLATAGALLGAALLVARLQVPPAERRERPSSEGRFREAFVGFGTILSSRPLRLLEALSAAQTLVAGAFNVLVVVSALELLDIGEAGVGLLNSAVGIGGLVGAVVAAALVGRGRLSGQFTVGLLLWGIPIALIGIFPSSAVALPLLVLVGVGNTIVDVAGLTLLQRAVPDNILARVFGADNSLAIGTLGLGAIIAPILIELIGVRGALVATGALLPVLTGLLFRGLAEIDAAAPRLERELALLRSLPIFAPLPAPVLEALAHQLVPVPESAGEVVFRQGDHGDRFYIVAEGDVDVSVDGRSAGVLGPGEGFGEIALLRDVPRTATVTARTDVVLYALERDQFVGAVTGHVESAQAADAIVAGRLGTSRSEVGSI